MKLTQLIAAVAHLAAYIPQWLRRIVLWREGYAVRLLHSPFRVHGSVEELTERWRDIMTSRISFASLSEEREEVSYNFHDFGESKKKVLLGPNTNVSSGIAYCVVAGGG